MIVTVYVFKTLKNIYFSQRKGSLKNKTVCLFIFSLMIIHCMKNISKTRLKVDQYNHIEMYEKYLSVTYKRSHKQINMQNIVSSPHDYE